MRAIHLLQLIAALGLASACDQVLGIRYTEAGRSPGGLGGLGGSSNERIGDAGTGGRDLSPILYGGGGSQQPPRGQGDAGNSGTAGDDGSAAGDGAGSGAATAGGAAGQGGAGDAGSPGWTPLDDLSRGTLVLWLDASFGVTEKAGLVSEWLDRSPFHHRAFPSQPTRSPTWVANAFGRHPALHFDGLNDKLTILDARSLQMGTQPFALEIVLKNETNRCCQQLIFTKSEVAGQYDGVVVGVNWWQPPAYDESYPTSGEFGAFLEFSGFLTTPFDDDVDYRDGQPRLLSVVRTETEFSIRVNGRALASGAAGGVDASAIGRDLMIGGHPASDQLQFEGAIAELVLASGVTDDDARELELGLMAKYYGALVTP